MRRTAREAARPEEWCWGHRWLCQIMACSAPLHVSAPSLMSSRTSSLASSDKASMTAGKQRLLEQGGRMEWFPWMRRCWTGRSTGRARHMSLPVDFAPPQSFRRAAAALPSMPATDPLAPQPRGRLQGGPA
ncbi:hypothetical protein IQ07DRAFT_432403 [Pyrenochaeta sp. DS3sAY3a]|nr:hypothetical protein IQ07DRAFT_432403 [Pyrenochaeta sp. DS3sAY3a]